MAALPKTKQPRNKFSKKVGIAEIAENKNGKWAQPKQNKQKTLIENRKNPERNQKKKVKYMQEKQ